MTHGVRSLVTLVLVTAAACGTPAPDPSAMVAAAEALDDRFVQAFNRADAAGVAASYAETGTVVSIGPDGAILDTRAKIEEGYRATFGAMPGAQLALTERHNAVVGNVVIGWGRTQATLPGAGGAGPTVLEGRYTDVKAQVNGTWVYVSDHASVPMVPPTAPPGTAPTTK